MAILSFSRVNALPAQGALTASTVYLVRNATNATIIDIYVTGDTTAELRHVMGPGDIDGAIATAIANLDGNDLPDIPGSKIISAISVDTSGNAATATRATSAAEADFATSAGSADEAAKLKTPRTINGVLFDGSANINVPAVDTETPRVPMTAVGVTVAPLVDGKVPVQYIPAGLDNIDTYPTKSDFPAEGARDVIYIAEDDNSMWRWAGTDYILIPSGAGGSDTALKLANARQIRLIGDVTGQITGAVGFDGTQDVNIQATLPTLAGAAGVGSKVTVNDKGQVTKVEALAASDLPDIPGDKIVGDVAADVSGNAATADKWKTPRTITVDGALNGTVTLDGSQNVTLTLSGGSSGVTPGTYAKVTVNAGGLVTAGEGLAVTDVPNLPGTKIISALTVDTSGKAATAGIADSAKGIELVANEW